MSLKYLGNDKQNASPNVPTGKTYSAICNKTHKQMHARLLFVMAMVNIYHNIAVYISLYDASVVYFTTDCKHRIYVCYYLLTV